MWVLWRLSHRLLEGCLWLFGPRQIVCLFCAEFPEDCTWYVRIHIHHSLQGGSKVS